MYRSFYLALRHFLRHPTLARFRMLLFRRSPIQRRHPCRRRLAWHKRVSPCRGMLPAPITALYLRSKSTGLKGLPLIATTAFLRPQSLQRRRRNDRRSTGLRRKSMAASAQRRRRHRPLCARLNRGRNYHMSVRAKGIFADPLDCQPAPCGRRSLYPSSQGTTSPEQRNIAINSEFRIDSSGTEAIAD